MNKIIFLSISFYFVTVNCDNIWWKHSTIYQIFVASFKDSNGDGIGDLKGITSKLDHFTDLGIDCLYITSFFNSSEHNSGYDITNYTDIAPMYGNMNDFDELMRKMKQKNIKLMIDLVINHSGKDHEWFIKSQNKIGKYTDYYVWANAKGYDKRGKPIPPNNWVSLCGTSAWTWNERRKQFYLHQFTSDQPDLNLRNEALKAELKQIIAFWIDKGAAGIRLDAAQHFVEDSLLRDEPKSDPRKGEIENYSDLIHVHTANTPETYQVLHEFRVFTDNYTNQRNKINCLYLAECTSATDDEMIKYFGKPHYPVVHSPFNFKLMQRDYWYTASQFNTSISYWLQVVPEWGTSNWMIENQDNTRIASIYCEEYSSILMTAIMTLPGIAVIYYGQEIGMSSFTPPGIDYDKSERLPMQWDNSMNAGFTTSHQPWLPVNSDFWRLNVADQKRQKSSQYHVFRKLQLLRKTQTFKYGDLKMYIVSKWIHAIVRSYPSNPTFITVINFGTNENIVNLSQSIGNLPKYLRVMVATVNSGYRTGDTVTSSSNVSKLFTMRPLSSIVLSTKS